MQQTKEQAFQSMDVFFHAIYIPKVIDNVKRIVAGETKQLGFLCSKSMTDKLSDQQINLIAEYISENIKCIGTPQDCIDSTDHFIMSSCWVALCHTAIGEDDKAKSVMANTVYALKICKALSLVEGNRKQHFDTINELKVIYKQYVTDCFEKDIPVLDPEVWYRDHYVL